MKYFFPTNMEEAIDKALYCNSDNNPQGIILAILAVAFAIKENPCTCNKPYASLDEAIKDFERKLGTINITSTGVQEKQNEKNGAS